MTIGIGCVVSMFVLPKARNKTLYNHFCLKLKDTHHLEDMKPGTWKIQKLETKRANSKNLTDRKCSAATYDFLNSIFVITSATIFNVSKTTVC